MKNDEKHSGLLVERPVYQIEELNRDYEYEKPYHTSKYETFLMYFIFFKYIHSFL